MCVGCDDCGAKIHNALYNQFQIKPIIINLKFRFNSVLASVFVKVFLTVPLGVERTGPAVVDPARGRV